MDRWRENKYIQTIKSAISKFGDITVVSVTILLAVVWEQVISPIWSAMAYAKPLGEIKAIVCKVGDFAKEIDSYNIFSAIQGNSRVGDFFYWVTFLTW